MAVWFGGERCSRCQLLLKKSLIRKNIVDSALQMWPQAPKSPDHVFRRPTSGATLWPDGTCRTTSADAPRQERPSGAEADRSGV